MTDYKKLRTEITRLERQKNDLALKVAAKKAVLRSYEHKKRQKLGAEVWKIINDLELNTYDLTHFVGALAASAKLLQYEDTRSKFKQEGEEYLALKRVSMPSLYRFFDEKIKQAHVMPNIVHSDESL